MCCPDVASDWLGFATTSRVRDGIASHGLLLDQIVASDRLVSVDAGESVVVLRLQNPQDELAILPEDVGEDMGPDQAAVKVRSWSATAPSGARSRRVPSPVLVAGVLQFALTGVFILWFMG